MKSIQVNDRLHEWLINQKNSEKRSIDAVISSMKGKIEELQTEYDAAIEMMLEEVKK